MPAWEINFDGLVGPTHNYAGLAFGNKASMANRNQTANPKAAALEGLAKMKLVADLGLKQALFPPQERPALQFLRRAGFRGSEKKIIRQTALDAPQLLAASYSASPMWTANAATLSPSADTADGRLHLTTANLNHQLHRSLEPGQTAPLLKTLFTDEDLFRRHPPLPPHPHFGDEGAANHIRLCPTHHRPGIEVFVYGRSNQGQKYPARHTLDAAQAVARMHQLNPERTLFIQQNPAAIDAGAFHNDVVSVGNGPVLLYHQEAFADAAAVDQVAACFARHYQEPLIPIQAKSADLSLEDSVKSYLFNSQLLTLPDHSMALVAPIECRRLPSVKTWLDQVLGADNPIASIHYVDLRQSMRNGGGPACLRLRAVVTKEELAGLHQGVLLTDTLYKTLVAWVERHYRDRLHPDDLADPQLPGEIRGALDQLTQILQLGSLYPFQRPDTA